MTDQDPWTSTAAGVDYSAAMVRAESDHLNATLHALVERLSSVPGLNMAVSYRQGKLRRLIGDLPYLNDLHRRTDPVSRLVVTVGSCSYWLQSDSGALEFGVEGAAVEPEQAQEQLSFSLWATRLFDAIDRQNIVNHESLVALRHLVEHDRSL